MKKTDELNLITMFIRDAVLNCYFNKCKIFHTIIRLNESDDI